MRTLLRKVSNGMYFQGPDRWTTDPVQAHDFKMIDRALLFIGKCNLTGVELVFAFKDRKVRRVPLEKLQLSY
jgi:hypothetical protein